MIAHNLHKLSFCVFSDDFLECATLHAVLWRNFQTTYFDWIKVGVEEGRGSRVTYRGSRVEEKSTRANMIPVTSLQTGQTPPLWFVAAFVHLSFSFRSLDLVPPRVLVCQHDEVTKPISTVVVSCLKCTRVSTIVLSFHWGHEEPPGVDLRAAIVWLEN